MLNTILILVAIAVTLFFIVAAIQPSDFRVTRTGTISAPASAVFAQVNDLQKWEAWSPWAKLDPEAKNSFEGPTSGTGAMMRWVGNNKVGQGSMTIIESRTDDFIRFKLEFLKPFAATNTAEFTFNSEDDQTTVTWTMYGKNNFMAKAIGLIMNCEKMVGGQFEEGLASLKSVVEENM
ncbi:MAG: SRPBCC family protein [Methylobacter sp.]|uniref:SRPBCC family protein n=1 Tax=Methylobacter sp. TaxID=2051955 RepID=UPI002731F03B|nr:SRPBCC family protein [Methylobacter sp.]MDP1665362.1 SRPBCC family protein [Methylobacter sp.]MDP1969985.1 SRPBCC family protein [Methylobacter sp.]